MRGYKTKKYKKRKSYTRKHLTNYNKGSISKRSLSKSSQFLKLNCSPENKNLNAYSCYSDDDLHKLRDVWNARHPDKPIKKIILPVVTRNRVGLRRWQKEQK